MKNIFTITRELNFLSFFITLREINKLNLLYYDIKNYLFNETKYMRWNETQFNWIEFF